MYHTKVLSSIYKGVQCNARYTLNVHYQLNVKTQYEIIITIFKCFPIN